jgi:redox-sensitive bicupin YhaK (pirin superfamily)
VGILAKVREIIVMSANVRKVTQTIEPQFAIEGAGVLLRRSFGPSRANRFDPFLLFDHFAFNDPIEGPIVGFPMHPHRGIETVTYMLAGNTRHRDSLGNTGVIGPGDVQWMTSGRGIMHEEMPKRGPDGRVDGFQLWVNLPAAEKMGVPRYQEVDSESIPFVEKDGTKVRVVAGEYAGVKGPVAEISAKPVYMDVALEPESVFSLALEPHHTVVAYVFEGEGLFGLNDDGKGEWIEAVKMVRFGEGDHVRIEAGSDVGMRFMFMAGAAFHEPIVPYGPFVMNTEAEIQQAFIELRNGTFVKD